MPFRRPYKKVPVAEHVVVVVAEQGGRDAVDPQVVDESAEVLVLVDEGNEGGTAHPVVGIAGVSSPLHVPHLVERRLYPGELVTEQSRHLEEAEGVEVVDLLRG